MKKSINNITYENSYKKYILKEKTKYLHIILKKRNVICGLNLNL